MKTRWIALTLVALVAAVTAGTLLRTSDRNRSPGSSASVSPKPALTVTTTVAEQISWPQKIEANGSVAAWQEAVIGAEAAGLRTLEVLVNVGDRVRRGQLLARLQGDTIGAELQQTRAGIAEAEATLAEAVANAERSRQLQESGFISPQQYSQSATAETTARARLSSLKARLAADEVRLSQTRISAPDDGVISARIATVGAVVQPGQELFRLIRGRRLEWRAEVQATDLSRVKPGMSARLTAAGGATAEGRVRMIGPTVDPQTRNGLVYVDLPAPGAIKAGMFARGEFELGMLSAMTLPQSAVLLRDGFSYVFKIGSDSRVTMSKVETGRRVGERVEIISGLPPDVRVVASGGGFLGDGDTVRVVEAVAQPQTPPLSEVNNAR
ncbi:MAG: efflux RND transporter periplasmic adaptor subunit [Burkholderiales bacterium]